MSSRMRLAGAVHFLDRVAREAEAEQRVKPFVQSSSVISFAVGPEPGEVLDLASPRCARPWKKRRRRQHRDAARRSAISRRVNSSSAWRRASSSQSNQESSLSWQ